MRDMQDQMYFKCSHAVRAKSNAHVAKSNITTLLLPTLQLPSMRKHCPILWQKISESCQVEPDLENMFLVSVCIIKVFVSLCYLVLISILESL